MSESVNTVNLYNKRIKNKKYNKPYTSVSDSSKANVESSTIDIDLSHLCTTKLSNLSININETNNNQSKLIDDELSSLPKEISAGAIIYNLNNNSVLMIQGLNRFFGFPKGHIENNETPIQTMIREVREETGLDLDKINYKIIGDEMVQSFLLNKKYKTDGPSKVNRINIFYVVLINEDQNKLILTKNDEEIIKLGWFRSDNAEKYMVNSKSNQLEFFNKAKILINNVLNNFISN